MTETAIDASRALIGLRGEGIASFLQGLVSNDMLRLVPGQARYAALLTPQGKLLADFIVMPQAPESWLLDVAAHRADGLLQRLLMYRLRRAIQIERRPELMIELGWGEGAIPPGAVIDPREARLGWRRVVEGGIGGDLTPYHQRRLALGVPGDASLTEDSYILECGFERLNGVDFRKGCYVGQEVTARMKHKTELKRRLVPVQVQGAVPTPAEVTQAERSIGTLTEYAGQDGLALLRLDRIAAGVPLTAGTAVVSLK